MLGVPNQRKNGVTVERVTHEIYHKVQQRCIMGWQTMQIETLANDTGLTRSYHITVQI